MKKYLISKIGGEGVMIPHQKLFDWVRCVLKDKEPDTQIIIVVSALAKITRMLQEIFEMKSKGEKTEALKVLDSIKRIHLQRCADLFIEDTNTLDEYFHEIEYFISHGSINEKNASISMAQLLKFGELMSSNIFHQFMLGMKSSVKLIDAQNMIYASGNDYCNSIPIQPKTSESISKAIGAEDWDQIILTQGYISKRRLLGLDGSDLTASLIAFGLQLCNQNCFVELNFWKNVDGVIVDGNVLDEISFGEYNLLETVPVRKDAIAENQRYKPKTRIRSFLNLDHPGTLITW